ncbi:hypothetical protein VTO42DRAFT_5696 [Malbranchea cinnamomea]
MNTPSFRPTRPFLFSLFTVSIIASKLLHLFQHGASISFLHFILYFPTFFVPDGLVVIVHRLLLHPGNGGPWPWIGLAVGTFMALLCFTAAASQLGFFYVTGAEMHWDAATSIVTDETAVRLMMTGIVQVIVAGAVLLVATFLSTPTLYTGSGAVLAAIWRLCTPANWKTERFLPTVHVRADPLHPRTMRIWPLFSVALFISVLILQSVRPSQPYDHISTTLPYAMLRIFRSPHPDACSMLLHGDPFPLADVISAEHWEMPNGNFKGWAPGTDNVLINQYKQYRPKWLSNELPSGFYRWTAKINATGIHGDLTSQDPTKSGPKCAQNKGPHYYNPVADPLRITNLDLDVFEPLKQAFKSNSVLISHIVFISMESGRKELFPIREGSHLHQQILETHDEEEKREMVNRLLSRLTPVAHQVTGEPFWSDPAKNNLFEPEPGKWRDSAAPGMGGVNVMGAVTGSTLSFKSFLGSHCGVFPLPVDFLEEVTTQYYQPCIPQILQLFNQAKDKPGIEDDVAEDHRARILKQKWKTVYIQSTTDSYDRQGVMNRQMGFIENISKETFEDETSTYYPPKSPELNYFGYPDTDAKPCFRDAIFDAAQNGSRLLLSHFTSATHHPWNVPKSFKSRRYMGSSGHDHMNSYLNTISYIDGWLGDILGLLDEAGIANETLVIFVGDHGQAFEEDSKMTGTYNNPHISNFRVPIVLRHPQLPRINVEANATSMSILPTILDLLIQSNSLNAYDTAVAADLIHEYQGQSLIRPFRSFYKGRRVWNIAIINAGGSILSVTSASVRWRVIVPIDEQFTYRFTDLETDPYELDPMEEWTLEELLPRVQQKYGPDAEAWLKDADAVTKWWVKEMHRLWNYEGKK